jgi:hypothetical protein
MATLEGILALPPRPAIQKLPCYLATTGNVTLTATNAPLTVDGLPTYLGARILVWQQSSTGENGLYVVQTASVAATGTLTFTNNPTDNQVVVINGKTYTFKAALLDVDGYVLIGATASDSLDNLIAAIDLGAGSGTLYAASTTDPGDVDAVAGAGNTMDVTAETAGLSGNSITTTTNVTGATWSGATLSGGEDGTWVRTQDWSHGEKDYLLAGASVYVQAGATHAQKTFTITTTAGSPGYPTVGSFGFVFEELSPSSVTTINEYLPYIQDHTAKTASFNAVLGEMHLVDTSGGGITATLPPIANGQGRIAFSFEDIGGQLTVDGNGAETIEGKLTRKFGTGTVTLENDGVEWHIVQLAGRNPTRLDPAQITADQNDYNPADWGRDVTHMFINSDATRTITGVEENGFIDMDSVFVCNDGSNNIVFDHDSASSTAANRILIEGGRSVILQPDGIVELIRDGTANQWRMRLPGRIELRSDTTQTQEQSGVTFPATQATASYTGTIDVNDYDDVDVYLEVLSIASITEVTVFAESSGKAAPASDEWAVLQSDDAITSGAVTLADYLAKEASPLANGWYHWNFPSRGAVMRFGVFANAAADTFNLFYKRNVRRG